MSEGIPENQIFHLLSFLHWCYPYNANLWIDIRQEHSFQESSNQTLSLECPKAIYPKWRWTYGINKAIEVPKIRREETERYWKRKITAKIWEAYKVFPLYSSWVRIEFCNAFGLYNIWYSSLC